MTTTPTHSPIAPTQSPPEFSLVQGGPLFQLYRRAHLAGDTLEFLYRRVLVIALIAWLPLLLLSTLDGHAVGGAAKISFLQDVAAHVRFLIALPALIIGEVIVHPRIDHAVRRLVERRIVVTEDLPRFRAAIDSAIQARDSVAFEGTLLILVYTVGHWIWRSQASLGATTWYAVVDASHFNLTRSGYWYAFVSIPIFQFLLLRWYMRIAIWFRLLWKISRLNLRLSAAHPDRAGGIAFLAKSSYAFGPLLFAQGALLAGVVANRILYEGRNLLSFKLDAAGSVGFFVFVILGPLMMFTPQLDRTKRQGRAEYGLLANRYVFGFEEKWIQDGAEETGELLGTPDLQSLADLANSYSVVHQMHIIPFWIDDVAVLAAVTIAPLLPLALTTYSLEQVFNFVMKSLMGQ